MTEQTSQIPAPEQLEHRRQYVPQWDRPTRLMITVILVIATIYGLTLLSSVITMLILAFILAFVMFTPTRLLARRTPLSYGGAVALVYLVLLIILVILFISLIPAAASGIENFGNSVQNVYSDLQQRLISYKAEDGIVDVLGFDIDFNFLIEPIRDLIIPRTSSPIESDITQENPLQTESERTPLNLENVLGQFFNVAGTLTGTVASVISWITGLLTTILLSLFLSFLILLDWPNMRRSISRWMPPLYHRETALLMERIERVWNGFFRGQVTLGFVITILTYLQLAIMGVPSPLVLAIFTGLISLIPTLGGIIALVPLFIVPLIQGSSVFVNMPNPVFALLVAGVNLIVSQIIWNVVAPKILGDALDLPLPVIIVGVFIGAAVGGILGAFLVAPVMGTIRVIVVYLLYKLAMQDPFPGEQPKVALGLGELNRREGQKQKTVEVPTA